MSVIMDRVRLAARRDAQGDTVTTWLLRDEERLGLWDETPGEDGAALPLPPGAVSAVLRRYGRPLEANVALTRVGVALDLPEGGAVSTFLFVPFGYLQPLDYVLYEAPGAAPVAAPTPLVVAALRALGRALG